MEQMARSIDEESGHLRRYWFLCPLQTNLVRGKLTATNTDWVPGASPPRTESPRQRQPAPASFDDTAGSAAWGGSTLAAPHK